LKPCSTSARGKEDSDESPTPWRCPIRARRSIRDRDLALDRVIEIFCDFWSSDAAIGRLHDATALDPEFAQAVAERNERRRELIRVLIRRMAPNMEGRGRHRKRCGRPHIRPNKLPDVPDAA
jgi:hypothetical protein